MNAFKLIALLSSLALASACARRDPQPTVVPTPPTTTQKPAQATGPSANDGAGSVAPAASSGAADQGGLTRDDDQPVVDTVDSSSIDAGGLNSNTGGSNSNPASNDEVRFRDGSTIKWTGTTDQASSNFKISQ